MILVVVGKYIRAREHEGTERDTETPSTLHRFQVKTVLFCSVFKIKRFASTLIVFVSFWPVHTTTRFRIENARWRCCGDVIVFR